jgi:hypothetical protein
MGGVEVPIRSVGDRVARLNLAIEGVHGVEQHLIAVVDAEGRRNRGMPAIVRLGGLRADALLLV